MVEMSDNLRAGARRTAPQPDGSAPKGRAYLAGQRPAPPRTLGYKPESESLVPITVSGHKVETGLADDYAAYGGPRPHRVRSFYRRGPGSPLNSPRTVLMQSHIRGTRFFEDATLLPAVTIKGNSRA